MMRVYPVVRSKIETILSAVDPLFDPARLALAGRFHASYFAGEAAFALAEKATFSCDFARVEALGGFVNFTLSADFLGGFTTAFLCALPPVALRRDLMEDELFSPILYAAARLNQFSFFVPINLACPDDNASKDALFALFGLAEWVHSPKLLSKAEQAADQLLMLVQSLPFDALRETRLSALSGLITLGARTLFFVHTRLCASDSN